MGLDSLGGNDSVIDYMEENEKKSGQNCSLFYSPPKWATKLPEGIK